MSVHISPIVRGALGRSSMHAMLGAGLVLLVASLKPLGAQDDPFIPRTPTAQSRSASVAELCRLADTYISKYVQDHNKTWIILALKGVRHARQSAPRSPIPYVSLTKIYLALDDADRAKQEAHNALALDPQCREAKQILALLEPPKTSPNDADENDTGASTEVVAESRRDFDRDGKVDTLSVVMIRGTHDASRGTAEGTFVARVEIDGVTADTFNLNEAFGAPTLSLPDHPWSIVFSDYNHDGQIDFNFGASVSAASGDVGSWQYKLFTISPEGRIQELRIENLATLPAAGRNPSTQAIVAAGHGFQYTAPDVPSAEDARRDFVWKPASRVFVESQEPLASHAEQSMPTQHVDGDTELLEKQVANELADLQKREDYRRQVNQQLQQVAESIDVAANRQKKPADSKDTNLDSLEAELEMEMAQMAKVEAKTKRDSPAGTNEEVNAEFLKNLENDLAEMKKDELTRSGPDSGKMPARPGGRQSTSPPVKGPAGAGHQLSSTANPPFGGKSVVRASGSVNYRTAVPASLRRMMSEADMREIQRKMGRELSPIELTINLATGQVSGTWKRLKEAKDICFLLGRDSSGFGLGMIKRDGKTYVEVTHGTLNGTYVTGAGETGGQISGTFSNVYTIFSYRPDIKHASEIRWSKQTQNGPWQATISPNGAVKGVLKSKQGGGSAEITAHIDRSDAR